MELEISIQEFQEKLKLLPSSPDAAPFLLLDVREPWETELCLLPGSHLISMADLPDRADQELDRDAHIVVVCHHGNRSLVAVMWLREQGFHRAQSLAGGLEEWASTVDPSMDRY
jgi:rhodanese-related sulfurtransferase